jgi:hypothetical protein
MATRKQTSRFRGAAYPTVEQINSDVISKLAGDYWAPNNDEMDARKPFDVHVVKGVYHDIVSGR